jgi:hypothetical protein
MAVSKDSTRRQKKLRVRIRTSGNRVIALPGNQAGEEKQGLHMTGIKSSTNRRYPSLQIACRLSAGRYSEMRNGIPAGPVHGVVLRVSEIAAPM